MVEKRILIPRSNGGNLHAVYFLSRGEYSNGSDDRLPFVIICHGFTGDKHEWGRFDKTGKALNEAGFDSLIFDFSGSGENEREFITLSKQAKDLEDVHAWVKNEGYSWIAVIGLSFGGLTLLVADLPGIKTRVFWAPAFYIKKYFLPAMEKSLKKGPLKLPASGKFEPILIDYSFVEDILMYDTISYLQKLETPVLVIQGTKDKSVRPADTREAYKHLPQDDHHELVEVEKAAHNFDGELLTRFIEATITWLKKYL